MYYLMPADLLDKVLALVNDPRTVAPTGPTLQVIREFGKMKQVHLDKPPDENDGEPGEQQDG